MISYDQYENRIKKVAKFRNFMNKYKFLFIAVFALVVAAVATLLSLKGSLSGEIVISSSVYGESYSDPEGVSAFWSDVSYEFAREESGEWTEEKPVKAGKYNVRAVSSKTIGKGYGKIASFEIAPREVEFSIVSESVEYGGVPKDISLELLSGDRLDRNSLLFVYDDYVSERTGVDLDESSVKIINQGDDRTACYTVKHEKKELAITKRSISVSPEKMDFVYSGSGVVYSNNPSEATEMQLANGDEIKIDTVALYKDGLRVENAVRAGNYEAVASGYAICKAIGGQKIDVTAQYDGRLVAVPFEISKKVITVTTASAEQIYDGTLLSKADGFEAAGLVAGDTLFVNASTRIVHAQTIPNKLVDYLILSADGSNVTADYEIIWQYGTLTVKPRPITVTSPDGSWIYDGNVYSKTEISCADEFFSVTAVKDSGTPVLTIGLYQNKVDYTIENKSTNEREDLSDFAVTEKWGTLQIRQREITVTIQSIEKMYDGSPLFATPENDEVTVTDGSLAAGDMLVSDRSGKLFSLTNVKRDNGKVASIQNKSEYGIECNGFPRTKNYLIRYERGTLTVNPRHISLLTNSNNFVYDGEPHSDSGCLIFENGIQSALIGGNKLALVGGAPAFTSVSETKGIQNNNVCVYDAGQNYEIDSVAYGTITILPRPLTVVTNSAPFVYDGNAHSDGGYSAFYNGGAGLVGEDELILLTAREVTVVGDTAVGNNVCSYSVPNDNYELKNYTYGTLTVNPRPLTVTSPSASWVYDGEKHSKAEIDCADQIFKVVVAGDPVTVVRDRTFGSVKNCVNYTIRNAADEVEDKANFAVTEIWGELAISARGLTVTSPSESWVYDAGIHSLAKVFCTDEYFTVVPVGETAITSIKDFGKATNEVAFAIVKKSTNEAENDFANFEITLEWGTLTVTAREIRVVTASDEKEYDGTLLERNEYVRTYHTNKEGEQAGLLGVDALTLKDKYSIFNVMESGENKCTFLEPNQNYKIIGYDFGTLTITPKHVLIHALDISSVYGEAPVYPSGKGNFADSGTVGFIGGDTVELFVEYDLSAYGYRSVERLPVRWVDGAILPYENAVVKSEARFTGSDEHNYEISYESGALTVVRRGLYILLDEVKTYYGEDIYYEDGTSAVYPKGAGNTMGVFFADDSEEDKTKNGLLAGDTLEVVSILYKDAPLLNPDGENGSGTTDEFVTPKNAAHYYIFPHEIKICAADGREEITIVGESENPIGANYLIRYYTPGELEILARPVQVTLNEIETRWYDGEAREYLSGGEAVVLDRTRAGYPELLKKSDAFGYGERLDVKVVFDREPIFRGEYIYSFDSANSTIEEQNGEGGYFASSRRLKNYNILCVNGVCQITKRPVTIQMNDITKTYGDYMNYDTKEYYRVVGEVPFVEGERIYGWSRILFGGMSSNSVFPVGEYEITGEPQQIGYHATPKPPITNVFDSYDITVLPGTLTVVPKEVTVTTWKRFGYYGSSGPKDWVLKFSNTDLAYDETMEIEYSYFQNGVSINMPKDVGIYDVQLTPVLSVGKEGLKNYTFVFMNGDKDPNEELPNGYFAGMLEIMPLPITVSVSQKDTIVYGDSISDAVEVVVVPAPPEYDVLPYGEVLTAFYSFQKNGVSVTPKFADIYDIVIGDQLLIDGSTEGMKNYDVTESGELKNGTLTITPREITVRLDSLTIDYGDPLRYEIGNDGTNYSILSGELVYGDQLFVTTMHLAAGTGNDRPPVGGYFIHPKEEIVLNGGADTVDGYKISDSYLFTIETGALTVKKRSISLELNPDFKESVYYDGKPHNYVSGGEEIGGKGMAEGETLQVAVGYTSVSGHSIAYQVVKADRYVCWFDSEKSRILYGEQEISLDNYEISVKSIERMILSRTVKISILDLGTKVYGEPVVYPESEGNYAAIEAVEPVLGGGLVDGETLQINVWFFHKASLTAYSNQTVLPVGDYEIVPRSGHTVNGGEYADENNYLFEFENGAVKVERRSLIVTLRNVEVDYGEQPAYYGGEGNYASVENLADGETLTVQSIAFSMPYQAQIGEYENAVALNPDSLNPVKIMRGEYDATDNYIVREIKGKLTVVKRNVTVTTATNSFVYDGEAHADGSYTVIYQANGANGLAYDDMSVLHADYERNLPSVEEYSVDATENKFAIAMKRGAVDVTRNYEITYTYGSLSVLQRIIYVATKSAEKVYDGTPLVSPAEIESCYHYKNNDATQERVDGLVAGHSFRFGTVSIEETGFVLNDTVEDILNAAGVSKKFNYIIAETELGKLTVHQRQIYVDASSDNKVYDGKPLISPDDRYTLAFYPDNDMTKTPLTGEENALVSGHSFIVELPSITDAGTIENNKFKGVTDGRNDVTKNYLILSRSGKLTVKQREVTITVGDLTMVYYNGAPKETPSIVCELEGETANRGILRSEADLFTFTPLYVAKGTSWAATRYNAGEYDIMLTIADGTGKNNYAFSVDVGLLSIEKASLFVKPSDRWENYIGADQEITISSNELEFGDSALASGDMIVSCELTRTGLKASENKMFAPVKIRNGSLVICDVFTGEPVIDNYNVVLSVGYIGFNQRTLYFEQIIPDGINRDPVTGRGLLPYSGERVDFTGGSNTLYRLLTSDEVDTPSKRAEWSGADAGLDISSYGLLDTDGAVLKSAYVGSQVRIYDQWVNLNVVNSGTGGLVSKLYNIVCVVRAGTNTSIEVQPVQAKISFSAMLTQSVLDNAEVGMTLLDSSYIRSAEGLLEGHLAEAAIYKDENGNVSVYVFIYLPRYTDGIISSRVNKSIIYSATCFFDSGISPNSELVGTAIYPKG